MFPTTNSAGPVKMLLGQLILKHHGQIGQYIFFLTFISPDRNETNNRRFTTGRCIDSSTMFLNTNNFQLWVLIYNYCMFRVSMYRISPIVRYSKVWYKRLYNKTRHSCPKWATGNKIELNWIDIYNLLESDRFPGPTENKH